MLEWLGVIRAKCTSCRRQYYLFISSSPLQACYGQLTIEEWRVWSTELPTNDWLTHHTSFPSSSRVKYCCCSVTHYSDTELLTGLKTHLWRQHIQYLNRKQEYKCAGRDAHTLHQHYNTRMELKTLRVFINCKKKRAFRETTITSWHAVQQEEWGVRWPQKGFGFLHRVHLTIHAVRVRSCQSQVDCRATHREFQWKIIH